MNKIKKTVKAKRVLTILLTIVMVATISLPGFIFADTELEEAATENQIVALEEAPEEDAEAEASETATPEEEVGESITALSATAPNIEIKVDDSVVADNSLVTFPWDGVNKKIMLDVDGIAAAQGWTDGQLTIKLPEGLLFKGWNGDASNPIGTSMGISDSDASISTLPSSAPTGLGYNALTREITYDITNDGVTRFFPYVFVNLDTALFYGNATLDDIELSFSATEAGTSDVTTWEKKLNVNVTGTKALSWYNNGAITSAPFNASTTSVASYWTWSDASRRIPVAVKDATMVFTFSNEVEVSNLSVNGPGTSYGNYLPNDGIIIDNDAHTITLKWKDSMFNYVSLQPTYYIPSAGTGEGTALGGTVYGIKTSNTTINVAKAPADKTITYVASAATDLTCRVRTPDSTANALFSAATGSRDVAPTSEINGVRMDGLTFLGTTNFENRSGIEINNQTLKMSFPKQLNVRMLRVPNSKNTTETTTYRIKIKANEETSFRAEKNVAKVGDSSGVSTLVPSDFGLASGEVLTEVEIKIDGAKFSGTYASTPTDKPCGVYGNINIADALTSTNAKASYNFTWSIGDGTDSSSGTRTVKVAQSTAAIRAGAGFGATATESMYTANAGETIPVWTWASVYDASYTDGTINRLKNPVLYVIIPDGMDIDTSSVKVAYKSDGVHNLTDAVSPVSATVKDITSKNHPNGKKLLVVKTLGVIGNTKETVLGNFDDINVYFEYKVDRMITTSKIVKLQDLIFWGADQEDKLNDASASKSIGYLDMADNNLSRAHKRVLDTYSFSDDGLTTDYLTSCTVVQTLTVNPKLEVLVGGKIKGSSESSYHDYTGVGSEVTFTPGATADYKVDIFNGTTGAASFDYIYIPVPKFDKQYGGANLFGADKQFQNSKFEWDMSLVGAPTYYDDIAGTILSTNTKFDVEYATVPDGESVTQVDIENATYNATPAGGFSAVNMVRIKMAAGSPTVAAGFEGSFVFSYQINETAETALARANGLNIWSPIYKYDAASASGKVDVGAQVGARLQTSAIKGFVFEDKLINGFFDSGSDAHMGGKGVTVTLTGKAGTATASVNETTNVGADGKYEFAGIAAGLYNVSFSIPTTNDANGNPYVFTIAGDDSINKETNSDAIRGGTNNGKVFDIDTTAEAAQYINAGFASNAAPEVTPTNRTIDTNTDFVFTQAEQITAGNIFDRLDTAAQIAAYTPSVVKSVNWPSGTDYDLEKTFKFTYAGTYSVGWKFTDSDGATNIPSNATANSGLQIIKVDGAVFSAAAGPMVVSKNDVSSLTISDLKNNVIADYLKAGDTIGFATQSAAATIDITSPAQIPTDLGVHTIHFAAKGGANTTPYTGTFKLTIIATPEVTATANSVNYGSGAKTNQDVAIAVAGAPGLTIKYRKGESGAWTDLQTTAGADGTLTVTTEELATYKFIYADGDTKYDGTDEVSSFTTDINKKAPKLTDGTNEIVNAKTYFKYPETNFAVTGVSQGVSDTVSSSYIKDASGSPIAYTDGSALDFGSYAFTLTDGYGNQSTYDFAIDHLWKVKFVAGDGGSLTGQTTVADIENGTKWEDVFDGFGGSGSANIPVPVADDNHTFSQWNVAFPAATDAIHADATYTAIFAGNLGVSANDASATYDGAAHGLTGAIATVGAVNAAAGTVISYGESASGPWESTSPTYTNAGTYTVYIKATNSDTVNFVDSPVVSKTVTIAKRGITVKPVNASKVYDGNILKHTAVELAGGSLVSGHSLNISGATFTGAQTAVGTSKGSVSGVSISGGDVANYEISYADGNLTVTAAPVVPGKPDKPDKPDTPSTPSTPNTPDVDDEVITPPTLPAPDSTTIVTTTPNGDNGTDGGSGTPIDGGGSKAPTSNIDGNKTPFAAPLNGEYWSLIDLLFVLLGLFIAIQKTVVTIRRRNSLNGDYDGARVSTGKPAWLIAAIGIAIASLVTFLLSQDITGTMAIIDGYTTVFVVLFAATMVAGHFSTKITLKNA